MHQSGKSILFSTAYFPPIEYFSLLLDGSKIEIEYHENYIKQSYRNRCKISSPNGIQVLSVPVERGSFHKVSISSLKIDYSRPWQNNHLRALKTAYNSSAFYEFYIDEIEEIVMKNHKHLFDMNMDILKKLMSILELENCLETTEKYIASKSEATDYRESIHPKRENVDFVKDIPKYFQVFSSKQGFIPNLSILDLIFNMGPESYSYLLSCKR